ncbi:16015_t:CDS:2, partial [Funneliformis geosporum]
MNFRIIPTIHQTKNTRPKRTYKKWQTLDPPSNDPSDDSPSNDPSDGLNELLNNTNDSSNKNTRLKRTYKN